MAHGASDVGVRLPPCLRTRDRVGTRRADRVCEGDTHPTPIEPDQRPLVGRADGSPGAGFREQFRDGLRFEDAQPPLDGALRCRSRCGPEPCGDDGLLQDKMSDRRWRTVSSPNEGALAWRLGAWHRRRRICPGRHPRHGPMGSYAFGDARDRVAAPSERGGAAPQDSL